LDLFDRGECQYTHLWSPSLTVRVAERDSRCGGIPRVVTPTDGIGEGFSRDVLTNDCCARFSDRRAERCGHPVRETRPFRGAASEVLAASLVRRRESWNILCSKAITSRAAPVESTE